MPSDLPHPQPLSAAQRGEPCIGKSPSLRRGEEDSGGELSLSWAAYPTSTDLPPPIISDPALPLCGIVTPSYNQGRFIRETIESVLSQDYPNLEYWVIDGGSTDETLSILREFEGDPRFHWIGEPDKGQSDAINKGWSRCQGDVLAWLCSDDVYCPGAVRTQIEYLLAHPDVDAVYGDAISIDEDGRPLHSYTSRHFSQFELLRICFIPQSTTFLRRRLVERTGIIDLSLNYALDYDYWLRGSLHGTFAYVPGEIARYRLHQRSKTIADSVRFFPEIERVIDRFFAQEGVPPELRRKRSVIRADNLLMAGTAYARAGEIRAALSHLRKSLSYDMLRPRMFWLLLGIFEAATHIHIADALGERWLRLRSRL